MNRKCKLQTKMIKSYFYDYCDPYILAKRVKTDARPALSDR